MQNKTEENSQQEDEALFHRLARKIVNRGLATPAVIFLESTKPLNMVGCQTLNFLEPIVQSIFHIRSYNEFIELMENRTNVEKLIRTIEVLEEERRRKK